MTDYDILYNLLLCIVGSPTAFCILWLLADTIRTHANHR